MKGNGRRALVVGLGLSGNAAAEALVRSGWNVVAIDSSADVDTGNLARLGVDVRVPHSAPVDGIDLLIKSPGVPGEAEAVQAARAAAVPVWSEIELATRLAPNPVLAITGTNGKTTTTELTAHLLREAGIAAHACGNQGTPITSLAPEIPPGDWLVTECSSFQLEDIERFHPRGAALLNLAPDHLDRHGSLEAYRDAKLRIFERLEAGDLAIAPPDLMPTTAGAPVRVVGREGAGAVAWSHADALFLDVVGRVISWSDAALSGDHNRQNMMVAAALAAHAGADRDSIARGLASFPGVPHRLEEIRTVGGVVFVNDSKATNPDAAIAALNAYASRVRLIAGGRGKGTSFEEFARVAARGVMAAYVIGETAADLARALGAEGVPVTSYPDLAAAVRAAAGDAHDGDIVLLAPACASFDQFPNYEARGDAFRDIVKRL